MECRHHRSRFFRLAYALFGRPGAQPFYPGVDASLMLPFDVGPGDFAIYYFHDVRIAVRTSATISSFCSAATSTRCASIDSKARRVDTETTQPTSPPCHVAAEGPLCYSWFKPEESN